MTVAITLLRTHILADATITNLIGQRLYTDVLPQGGSYPAIVYQYVSGNSEMTHDGPDGLENTTLQFDVYATTAAKRDEVYRALRDRIHGHTDATIQGIFLASWRDIYEDELELYRRSADFDIWNAEG